ncbi:MAG TPA: hypothetical protein VFF11_10225, partial [Candidatus Binatia bacterium]|nr:hypothetical protein [Candidatus Binatia bacterium]
MVRKHYYQFATVAVLTVVAVLMATPGCGSLEKKPPTATCSRSPSRACWQPFPGQVITDAVPELALPLPLSAVRLTGGPLKHAQDLDAAY